MTELHTSPICPGCASSASTQFYSVPAVPVHQVKLVPSREAARACREGDIGLRFCSACGFVWNAAFDPARMSYQEDYESTQTVSPTFNRFHERLAHDLIDRFDLRHKKVVEVGCGQGEFITMLAEIGGNHGDGFDQVHRGEGGSAAVTFVKDFYGPAYQHLEPDFVCCKMTLEHVHDTGDFLRSMRKAMGDRPDAVIFFMIPEVTAASPTHGPGHRCRPFLVIDDQVVGKEIASHVVERLHGLSIFGPPHHQLVSHDGVGVKGVEGMSELEHHVIGHVDDVGYRSDAKLVEAVAHGEGRRAHGDSRDLAGGEPATA
jgi:hypothetical protein